MSPENNTIVIVPEDAPQVPVAIDDSATLLAVISRAASDPSVDVDKLERLMAMHERFEGKKAEAAFAEAMTRAQSRIGRVATDRTNNQTRSEYASYAALDRAVRPIYTDEGFALSFDTGRDAHADMVKVLCYVSHKNGHVRTYSVDMPADGKGAKGGDVMTKTHAAGSAMQYGMRYLLKMIFNIAIGKDDDGNGATGALTDKQLNLLLDLWAAWEPSPDHAARFYEWAGCDSLEELPPRLFDNAVSALEKRIKQKGAK